MTKNMRSASERCAIEKIATRGLPASLRRSAADVERVALQPELEAGRGEQVVERQRELEAVLLREEGVEVEHADLGERRLLDLRDQRGEVERLALGPRRAEDAREQDVLAALDRVGVDAEERQQARRDGADLLADAPPRRSGRRGGANEPSTETGRPGVAARRVDREVGRVAQALDARAVLAPVGEALRPQLGLRLA